MDWYFSLMYVYIRFELKSLTDICFYMQNIRLFFGDAAASFLQFEV